MSSPKPRSGVYIDSDSVTGRQNRLKCDLHIKPTRLDRIKHNPQHDFMLERIEQERTVAVDENGTLLLSSPFASMVPDTASTLVSFYL